MAIAEIFVRGDNSEAHRPLEIYSSVDAAPLFRRVGKRAVRIHDGEGFKGVIFYKTQESKFGRVRRFITRKR